MNGNVNNFEEAVTSLLSAALPTVLWIFGIIVAIKMAFHFYAMARGEPINSRSNKSDFTRKVIIKPEVAMELLEQDTKDEIILSKGIIQFPKTVKLEK